jgi:glycosyltransferase involved in cell wall biosynthesis
MSPKISVIVPVYNAEAFLERCVDSILGQTLTDIEAVLVDDGSTDGSGAIIDAYAARDRRVTAIHTENRTTPYARAVGVEAARGKYIAFADSDDLLPETALEQLCEAARREGTEVVSGDYFVSSHPGSDEFRIVRRPLTEETPVGAMRQTLLGQYGFALWGRLFDREFYRCVITETPRYYLGDDGVVWLRLLARARKVVHLSEPVYYYVLRQGSLSQYSSRWGEKYVQMYLYQFDENVRTIAACPAIAKDRTATAFFHLYMMGNLLSKSDRRWIPRDSDLWRTTFGEHYRNRKARKMLKEKTLKGWIFLCAERNVFWRIVRGVLWGSAFSRTFVRKISVKFPK